MIYIGIDGDNVGTKIEKSLLENDEINVARVSEEITSSVIKITNYLKIINFKIIFSTGDDILCKGESIEIDNLSDFLAEIKNTNTFSVGIGNTLEKTYVALKYAKSIGKNKIVKYTENNKLEVFNLN